MINSACERIKELESELLEKDIAYKAMMEQRNALAARCERLYNFGASWAEKAGCDDQAWDYLEGLRREGWCMNIHNAEFLNRFLNTVIPRLDAGGSNPIDQYLHHCEYTIYQERERIHSEAKNWTGGK